MGTHLLRAIFTDITTKTSVCILFCTPDEINDYLDETTSYFWYTDLSKEQQESTCTTCLLEREITVVDRERVQRIVDNILIDGFVTKEHDIPLTELTLVTVKEMYQLHFDISHPLPA